MANVVSTLKDQLNFENVLSLAMRSPGVKINREHFLRKELIKYYPEGTVNEAICCNPAKAGVAREIVDRISIAVINSETTKVTGFSVAASLPGGGAAIAAAAADITSYFAFVLRTLQELAYLYGFEQFDLNDDEVDAETMNMVLLFLGVMFGVQGAATTLRKFADVFAEHVAKKLAHKALTKGTLYPIIKKVAASVGIRMTKQIFADSVASAVPIVGGILSGGLTFAMFKPSCMKLRKNLRSYSLSDPDFYSAETFIQ